MKLKEFCQVHNIRVVVFLDDSGKWRVNIERDSRTDLSPEEVRSFVFEKREFNVLDHPEKGACQWVSHIRTIVGETPNEALEKFMAFIPKREISLTEVMRPRYTIRVPDELTI